MSAQEQMKKILDELMGTSRDGKLNWAENSHMDFIISIIVLRPLNSMKVHVSSGNARLYKHDKGSLSFGIKKYLSEFGRSK
jgi:hypothetical protein